jgi:hypothetical protein
MGRTFLLAVCCMGASVTASAETAKTLYYVGEADFNFLADPNFIAGHKDFYIRS